MTIPMPEPDIFDGTRLDGSIASHGYSATALEAYAAAKVREALEDAASMADDVFAFSVGDSIRALIPQQ